MTEVEELAYLQGKKEAYEDSLMYIEYESDRAEIRALIRGVDARIRERT